MKQLMQKGDKVTLFRLGNPFGFKNVIKRCKNLIVLEDSSRWNNDGTPQDIKQLDFKIEPYAKEHQLFIDQRVTVVSTYNIQRTMRIKKIFKESLVLDYGENSNFAIKFSLITGKAMTEAQAWSDFKLTQEAMDKYKNLSNENE